MSIVHGINVSFKEKNYVDAADLYIKRMLRNIDLQDVNWAK